MTATPRNAQDAATGILKDRAALLSVARAVSDLRRGWPAVLLMGQGHSMLAAAPDTMEKSLIAPFHAHSKQPDYLLLTAVRARHLGIGSGVHPVRLPIEKLCWESICACMDPLQKLQPSVSLPPAMPCKPLDETALFLVKQCGLLPALLVSDVEWPQRQAAAELYNASVIEEADVHLYPTLLASSLHEISRAQVPLQGAQGNKVEVVSFRTPGDMVEHVAILIGNYASSPVIRLHSSCFTGDILGSLRCDCGDQLRLSIQEIAAAGGGAILYLNEEGRGIGIANKLRAYQLQDGGMDTVEANEELGFEADERSFHLAAAMLRQLGMPKIKLLTNNPQKVQALKVLGIEVKERLPLVIPSRPENSKYLDTKASKCGHLL